MRGSGGVGPESINLFIEDKAFSLSYDLPTPSSSPVSKLSLFLSFPMCRG
jgi:hypothetical protein